MPSRIGVVTFPGSLDDRDADASAIIQRLHAEIAKILNEADMQERLGKLGMQGADMTIDQIGAFQKEEVAKWAAVIKSANIKLE